MDEAGFGITWVKDKLIEATIYFEGKDYTTLLKQAEPLEDREQREDARALSVKTQEKIGVEVDYQRVLENTKAISERKDKAYEIIDLIRASELRIEDIEKTSGINLTPARVLLSKAEIEFNEERYEDAIKVLAQIDPTITKVELENTLIKAIYRASKETTANYIKEHYVGILVTLFIIGFGSFFVYKRVSAQLLERKIKDMDVEKGVLLELIKNAQRDYYQKGSITKKTYQTKVAKHKERMLHIKEQIPVLQARLKNMTKRKA